MFIFRASFSNFVDKMEEEIVEGLEGKLSNLAIEEEKYEAKEGTDDDRVAEIKRKYNAVLIKAKEKSRDGDLEGCLRLYKKAYNIHKSDKVIKRIKKLESVLQDSNSDDSTTANEQSDIGNGFKLSDDISDKLYPYQREGVLWFWKLFQEKKGGILGDDMGLGKTIQVISFLSGMFEAEHIAAVLIVMPVSLLTNWEKEFERWAPEIRVSSFHGSNRRQRSDVLHKTQSRNGVCLTTYGLVNTCHSQFSENKYGREFIWDYIILDEGHKIKNTSNKTTKAIRNIPALNHFILTGTPIQNNLREMWALFDFVCQGQLLGTSKSFKTEFENPIVRARERDATAYEKRIGQEMSCHLRELIAPHFLRRTKDILEVKPKPTNADQVDGVHSVDDETGDDTASEKSEDDKMAKLTRKNDLIIWLYLSDTQLHIYKDFLGLDRVKEILMTTRSPLAELNVLKKVCDHPRLLSTMACQQLGLNEEQDDVDENEKYQWCAPPVEQLIQESGKMVFLVHLLQQLIQNGHRTLVFSQSRKMLDIMQKVLVEKGIKIIRIDGTITSIAERESRINTFQTVPSYSVFLLTTQVGGVGLTLTAADRVVIFDPSWNPATDAQAVDRVYRIGQKKTVVVYRLITCGSLEEKIYRKQVFKQAITKQTTGSSNNPYRYFSRHELRDLFVLDDPKSSKTQIQLDKMHSANRVSDTKLDEHVAFLYSMNIFGISDHDLLFSKEAVATQDELEAGHEMKDIIQAKIRRAADIMKSESSQATEKRSEQLSTSSTPGVTKKSQTKISDHIEMFKPSREDNKRFMPKKSQPSRNTDVIDITVLDNEMDEADKLGEQFSAIIINEEDENKAHSVFAVKDHIVLDTPENNMGQSRVKDVADVKVSNDSLKNSETSEDDVLNTSEEDLVEIDDHNKVPEVEGILERPQQGLVSRGGHEVIDVSTPCVIDDKITNVRLSRKEDNNSDDDFQENISVKDIRERSSSSDGDDSEMSPLPRKDDEDFQENISENSVEDIPKRSSGGDGDNLPRSLREDDVDVGFSQVKGLERNAINETFSVESDAGNEESDAGSDESNTGSDETNTGSDESNAGSEHDKNSVDDVDYRKPQTLLNDKTEQEKTKNNKTEDEKEKKKDAAGSKAKLGVPERGRARGDEEAGNEARYRTADVYDTSEESSSDSDDQDSEVDDEMPQHNKGKQRTRVEIQESGSDDDEVIGEKNKSCDKDEESDKEKSPELIISSDDDGIGGGGARSRTKRMVVDSEEDDGMIEDDEGEERMDEEISGDREEGKIMDNEEDNRITEDIENEAESDREDEGEAIVDNEEDSRIVEDTESEEEGDSEEEGVAIVDNEEDSRIIEDTESEEEGDSEEEGVAIVDNEEDSRIIEDTESEEEGDSEEEGVAIVDNKDGRIIEDTESEEEGDSEEEGVAIVDNKEDGRIIEDTESEEEGDSEEEGVDIVDNKEDDRVTEDNESEKKGDSEENDVAIKDNEDGSSSEEEESSRDSEEEDGKTGTMKDDEEYETAHEQATSEEESDEDEEKKRKEVKSIKRKENSHEKSDKASQKKHPQLHSEDESQDETEKENLPLNGSRKQIHKQPGKNEKVLQPATGKRDKTSCCPRGKHVSQFVDINRCPCVMSSEEQEAYKMHVNTARRYERSDQLQNALKHYVNAFKLCDSDERLHLKLKKVHQGVKQNQ